MYFLIKISLTIYKYSKNDFGCAYTLLLYTETDSRPPVLQRSILSLNHLCSKKKAIKKNNTQETDCACFHSLRNVVPVLSLISLIEGRKFQDIWSLCIGYNCFFSFKILKIPVSVFRRPISQDLGSTFQRYHRIA